MPKILLEYALGRPLVGVGPENNYNRSSCNLAFSRTGTAIFQLKEPFARPRRPAAMVFGKQAFAVRSSLYRKSAIVRKQVKQPPRFIRTFSKSHGPELDK